MEVLPFVQALAHFSEMMETTNSERTQFLIRHECGDTVVMSKAEYDSIQETLHLYASSENARRLNRSIAELEAGSSSAWKSS